MASSGRFCCVPSCSSVSYIQKHSFTSTEICNALDSVECDSAIQKPLCEIHYQLVYHFISAGKNDPVFCQICRVKHKHEHATYAREKFIPYPNPTFVESFLRDTIGFKAHINEANLLCFQCYKYFKSLLNRDICALVFRMWLAAEFCSWW